jgi:hypothetical protein
MEIKSKVPNPKTLKFNSFSFFFKKSPNGKRKKEKKRTPPQSAEEGKRCSWIG